MKNKRVVVGLSGGVDSSVAAYLLKEQGYDVIGIFMKNWTDDSVILDNECPWVQDSNDALMVAEKLGIPYYVIDLTEEYKKDIVDYMFDSYANGLTPNPDVLCNYHIKFGHFLRQAEKIGADYIATGHYARKVTENGYDYIQKGVDPKKDQSYFLCRLTQDQISKALFPLGNYSKDQVREIAKKQDLVTANKKDSQGLCFVGNIKLSDFLSQKLKPKAGLCIDLDTNEIVGQHKGAHFFTRGQSKGIGVSGQSTKYFVARKDVKDNILYVVNDKNHEALNDDEINLNWAYSFNDYVDRRGTDIITNIQYVYHGKIYENVKVRLYADWIGTPRGCVIKSVDGESFYAPEKGQFLVGYDNDDKIILSGEIS